MDRVAIESARFIPESDLPRLSSSEQGYLPSEAAASVLLYSTRVCGLLSSSSSPVVLSVSYSTGRSELSSSSSSLVVLVVWYSMRFCGLLSKSSSLAVLVLSFSTSSTRFCGSLRGSSSSILSYLTTLCG